MTLSTHPPSQIRVFTVRLIGSLFLYANSEDSDQTVRMSRLIWASAQVILLVLSWSGSNLSHLGDAKHILVRTFKNAQKSRIILLHTITHLQVSVHVTIILKYKFICQSLPCANRFCPLQTIMIYTRQQKKKRIFLLFRFTSLKNKTLLFTLYTDLPMHGHWCCSTFLSQRPFDLPGEGVGWGFPFLEKKSWLWICKR